jgi:hypothetical protein
MFVWLGDSMQVVDCTTMWCIYRATIINIVALFFMVDIG